MFYLIQITSSPAIIFVKKKCVGLFKIKSKLPVTVHITNYIHLSIEVRYFKALPKLSLYAIMCQQCLSILFAIRQTGQSLQKRINDHEFDIRNHNIEKTVGELFNLVRHAVTDLIPLQRISK